VKSRTSLCTSALALLLVAACGSNDPKTHAEPQPSGTDTFDPGPVPEGYTRYDVPDISDLQPGADEMWCQWIAAPSDQVQNVLSVQGKQGVAGHHAALYANSVIEPVGTTRICKDEDMLTVTFLGAVGGEGTAGPVVSLPEGMVFQMPQGQALMANTHYINTTNAPVEGHTVLDVKFAPPDPSLIIAGSFAMNYSGMQIPPGQEMSVDVQCTLDRTVSLVMYSNHMHRWGRRVFTEVKRTDGTTEMLSKNDTWTADGAFNPPFIHWGKDAPFVLNSGDTLHEQCTWQNTTNATIQFPTEMCVGVGYSLEGGSQYICNATPM
jgi:hypothetical protein